jgi:hypothetical protein
LKKKTFILTKHIFFLFYLKASYFQSSQLSHFFFTLNDLKWYRNATLSSTKITIEQQKRKFMGVQELVVICYYEFLTPPTLAGHNFLILDSFWTIFSALDVPRGGVQHFLKHQKQKSPPLGSRLP